METTTDAKSTITLFDIANSQLQTLFFNTVTIISYAFSPAKNKQPTCCAHKNLHQQRWPTVTVITAEMHHPPPHCTHTHCLISINVQQAGMSMGAIFFNFIYFAWRNSIIHLCFICSSMSETILSDCPSAAIYCTATKHNEILVGKFSFYCHTTNILPWHHEQT